MSSSVAATPRYSTNRFWPDPGRHSPLIRCVASLVCLALAWVTLLAYDQFGIPSSGMALLKQSEDMLSAFALYGVPQSYGWGYLIGAVLLLAVHGLGQSLAALLLRLKTSWKTFIPFYGSHSVLQSLPRNMWVEAVVSIAGPLLGSVFAIVASFIYHLTEDPVYLAIAYFGYFYNLLSLTPLLFFDGNRVVAAIPRLGWFFGFVSVAALEVGLTYRNETVHCNTFLIFISAIALPQAYHSLLGTPPRRDLECTVAQRIVITTLYFSLLLALGWMSAIAFDALWSHVTPEAMGD